MEQPIENNRYGLKTTSVFMGAFMLKLQWANDGNNPAASFDNAASDFGNANADQRFEQLCPEGRFAEVSYGQGSAFSIGVPCFSDGRPNVKAFEAVARLPEAKDHPKNGQVAPADIWAPILHVSLRSPLTPEILAKIIGHESYNFRDRKAWDHTAKSGNSSATGLCQFLPPTAMEQLYKNGAQLGYPEQQKWIKYTPNTKGPDYRLKHSRYKGAFEKLLQDKSFSVIMCAANLLEYAPKLEADLAAIQPGKEALNGTELYMVHLMGYSGAKKFLTAYYKSPNDAAKLYVANAAYERNPGVFYLPKTKESSRQDLTVGQVYKRLAEDLGFGYDDLPSFRDHPHDLSATHLQDMAFLETATAHIQ